jgi:hypothetical protein
MFMKADASIDSSDFGFQHLRRLPGGPDRGPVFSLFFLRCAQVSWRIAVRGCSSFYGCQERCLRVTVGRREENQSFLEEFEILDKKMVDAES